VPDSFRCERFEASIRAQPAAMLHDVHALRCVFSTPTRSNDSDLAIARALNEYGSNLASR